MLSNIEAQQKNAQDATDAMTRVDLEPDEEDTSVVDEEEPEHKELVQALEKQARIATAAEPTAPPTVRARGSISQSVSRPRGRSPAPAPERRRKAPELRRRSRPRTRSPRREAGEEANVVRLPTQPAPGQTMEGFVAEQVKVQKNCANQARSWRRRPNRVRGNGGRKKSEDAQGENYQVPQNKKAPWHQHGHGLTVVCRRRTSSQGN